jgi:glucokinase
VRFALGIDIGGTNLVVGSVSEDGSQLVALRTEPTMAEAGADDIIIRLLRMARITIDETHRVVPGAEFLGVGIGSPGPLDRTTGVVLLTPNLGWVNFPLRQRIAEGLGMDAALDNDANCAVLGEWWVGAAQDARLAVGLTLGTGIGGGIIIDGRLLHGVADAAGELGHTTIEANGRQCKCGNYGCLEAYASGPAIAQRAVEALDTGEPSALHSRVGGVLSAVTAQTVYEAAADGDAVAQEVVADTAKFLGAGVANLLNTFNPDVVVICGGVTRAGDSLFLPLRREVSRRAFRVTVNSCRIVPGALLGTAGVYGAARTFLDARAGEAPAIRA